VGNVRKVKSAPFDEPKSKGCASRDDAMLPAKGVRYTHPPEMWPSPKFRRNPMPSLSLLEFVERWKASTLSERAASHSHFIDLCEVLGQPHPAAADQSGDTFTFEKHVSTLDDGKGFADVWKRGFFAWEYKGKHKSLSAAYAQLVRYQGDLENPPLLVTCDQERFEVHTNFTGTRPLVYSFTLDELLTGVPTRIVLSAARSAACAVHQPGIAPS